MRIACPKLIISPYEWLPAYGESMVSFYSSGNDSILDVEYERESSLANGTVYFQKFRREITFSSVSMFLRVPFPGSAFFEFDRESGNFKLGDLTEFMESDLIESCFSVYPKTRAIRHFSIQFLSENVAFHVLSEAVLLSDEKTVS